MAIHFKDKWLEDFYFEDCRHRKIPANLHTTLYRKLQMLDMAKDVMDLRSPPGNQLEALAGNLTGWYSIRVNKQHRIIFRWHDGHVLHACLDPHTYRGISL